MTLYMILKVLEALFRNCSQLKSLDLWFWRNRFATTRHTGRAAAVFELMGRNCQALEELDLGWCDVVFHIKAAIAEGMLPKLRKLFLTASRKKTEREREGERFISFINILVGRDMHVQPHADLR